MSVVIENRTLGLRRGRYLTTDWAEAWHHQKAALKLFLLTVDNWERPNCRLISPTGSGKTLIVKRMAMAWAVLGRVVIIAVPSKSIKPGFLGQQFMIDGQPQHWTTPMNFTKDFEDALRDDGEVQTLRDFLSRPDADPRRRFWVCTHAALLAAFRAGVDFGKAYVVIDEAHHFAAEGANGEDDDMNVGGNLLQHMLLNKVPHLLCTATPFRGDRRAIIPRWGRPLYATYTRERAYHLDDMKYVTGMNTRAVAGHVGEILDREFAAIKRQKRKAIVSLPRVGTRYAVDYGLQLGDGGHSKYDFEAHITALAKKHRLTIVSIATDESEKANGKNLEQALSAFRDDPKDPEVYSALPDIVLVLERYKEGTDCAAWSTVIQIGLPGSPVEILQFQGRGLRDHRCKDGMLIEYLCLIPAPDPKDEHTFEHALDTVKSLVVLGFMATQDFEALARTLDDDGDSGSTPFDQIDDALKAVYEGKATAEQSRILRLIGMALPEPAGSVESSPPAAAPGVEKEPEGGDGRSAKPEATEPKPLPLLSRRFGLDVEAISDEEVIKMFRSMFLSMAKSIDKGSAKKFHAYLASRSETSRRMQIATLYEEGNSLRQVVAKLQGRVTDDEVYRHLRAMGKLRPADQYRVKPKVRRKPAPPNANQFP